MPPDTPAVASSRAAFEAWFYGPEWRPQSPRLARTADGGYLLMSAHAAWGAWQAGEAHGRAGAAAAAARQHPPTA